MYYWVVYALLFAISTTIFNLSQKWAVNDFKPVEVTFGANFLSFLLLIPFGLLFSNFSSFTIATVALLIASGISNALSYYCYTTAMSYETVGFVSSLKGLIPILIALTEPLLYGNLNYNIKFVIASIIVGLGVYIVSIDDSIWNVINNINSKGLFYGVASSIILVVAIHADRFAVTELNTPILSYAAFLSLSTSVFIFFVHYYKINRYPKKNILSNKKVISTGISRALGFAFGITSLSITTGTKFNIIVQIAIPLTVFSGWILFSEKEGILKRVAGTILILTGIIILFS